MFLMGALKYDLRHLKNGCKIAQFLFLRAFANLSNH